MEQVEDYIEDIAIENTHKTTVTDRLIVALRIAFVVSILLIIYRLAILAFNVNLGDIVRVGNHASVILAFFGIAVWTRIYGYYRASYFTGTIEFYSEYSVMKVLSFLVSLCCVLRIIVSVIYLMRLEYTNAITTVYVGIELTLWAALAIFFFCFGYDRRRRARDIAAKDESIKK